MDVITYPCWWLNANGVTNQGVEERHISASIPVCTIIIQAEYHQRNKTRDREMSRKR